jgi:hypothetical protein
MVAATELIGMTLRAASMTRLVIEFQNNLLIG